MSKMKYHSTMFMKASNEQGFIQCTIKPEQQTYFEDLGFVDSLDKITADTPLERVPAKEYPAVDPVTLKPADKKATKKATL